MGSGNWSHDAYKSVSSTRTNKSVDQVFTAKSLDPALDPTKIVLRDSRDSLDHPNSHAIVVAFDVTGSMGEIPHYFAKEALGTLMRHLLDKQPVSDPQLLVAAVGDSTCDRSPLQVGQFESDNRVDDWLTKIFVEGGGGGQQNESYGLAYHLAGNYTSIDCFEKRGEKGFLFTIGDEMPWARTEKGELDRVFGASAGEAVSFEQQLASARRMYECFHVVVASRSYAPDANLPTWRKYMGQHVLVLDDYKALAELIMATVGLNRGMTASAVTAGMGAAATDLVLRSGATNLTKRASADIVTL